MPAEREPTRLQELLVDRALGELDAADARELEMALRDASARDPTLADEAAGLEGCCAAALLGVTRPRPLPASLREKLHRQGCACLDAVDTPMRLAPRPEPTRVANRQRSRWLGYAGWLAAAAAIAVVAYPRLIDRSTPTVSPDALAASLPMPEQLDRFIREAPDVQMIQWVSPDNAVRCQGDVCWSQVRQRGYMRFTGLPRNDPTQMQYQLWIFDAERPEATPVDGGVFDVQRDDGMVIVPIDAKLPIHQAAAFAITRERPGGVVVSDRKGLVLLASK